MPTLHPQGPRKVTAWQRARHRVRSDLGLRENRAFHVSLKPYKSHRRDISPFPFSFTSVSHNPVDWFGNKRFVLGIVVLSVIIGGILLSEGPLFHNVIPNPSAANDPFTLIWGPSGSSTGFSHGTGAAFNSPSCSGLGVSCETISSTSTSASVAISTNNVGELGIVNGKELRLNVQFAWRSVTNCCLFSDMGWFLTTNSSVASNYSPSYSPFSQDKQIIALFDLHPAGGGNALYNFYLNKNPISSTMQSGDTGECSGSGSCFIGGGGQSMALVVGNVIDQVMNLNYTGTAASGGNNGASFMLSGNTAGPTTTQTFSFPTSSIIQANSLYLGFFMTSKSGSSDTTAADFLYEPNQASPQLAFPAVVYALPVAALPVSPPPTIDTGGFFGPIIRALIQIGVFILQNLITFGQFLAGIFWPLFTSIVNAIWALIQTLAVALQAVIVAVVNVFEAIVKSLLNTIGQTFGFPASSGCNFSSNPGGCGLGDDLFQDITYLISAITSSIATFIGGVSNIFTALLNFFTAITTWFTTWGTYFLNAILAIVNLASEAITVVKNLLLYAPSTFTWGAIVLFIVYASLDGLQGWYSFFETTAWLVLFGIGAAEKILNWLISSAVWVISQIPAFNVQADALTFGGGAGGKYMVGFDLPRLPLIEHNFKPSFPHNFTDPEIRRFNVFSIMGLVVGTFMLIYSVGANLVPGVSAANGVNLNLINALLPIGLVMLGALGAVTLPFLLGYLFRNVFGIQISTPSTGLSLSTERISLRTGKVKGPRFKVGVRQSKHKFQVRTEEDGKRRTVSGLRNIIREGKRQSAASQERLRRETESLREKEVQAQRQREHEQRQRTERRRELETSPEGFE